MGNSITETSTEQIDKMGYYIPNSSDIEILKKYYSKEQINFNTDDLSIADKWRERMTTFYEDKCTKLVCASRKIENPLVSVIIPAYNIEKYIGQCIDSVLSQTLKNIEIICIDDGSTDGTLEVLKKYSEKDERISVYTQKNGGASYARNFALTKAKGEYYSFIDGDDYLANDKALEIMYNKANADNLDILLYKSDDFCDEGDEFSLLHSVNNTPKGILTGPQMLEQLLKLNEYRVVIWSQFTKRTHCCNNGLYFVNGIIHEDNSYTLMNFLTADRVEYIDDILYMQRRRSNSSFTSKITFYSAFCEYLAYRDMKKTLERNADKLTVSQYIEFCSLITARLMVARKKFSKFDENEKACALYLPLNIQKDFVHDVCSVSDLYVIKQTLHRTYDEKSEINRKLQITYKEKAERGEEIKRLKNENQKLKEELKTVKTKKSILKKIKSKLFNS